MFASTGPADLRDQRWLDERVADINNGIDAVLDIAANWTGGRSLSRLHPGVSAQEYILDRVPATLGPGVIVPLLAESNWSNRQIAVVAGVNERTVRRTAANAAVERPAETLGADGKLRTYQGKPRLDPEPYAYSKPRTVTAIVIDAEPPRAPFRVIAQAFERDARRLIEGYQVHLDDERFAARFGPALAALLAALEG